MGEAKRKVTMGLLIMLVAVFLAGLGLGFRYTRCKYLTICVESGEFIINGLKYSVDQGKLDRFVAEYKPKGDGRVRTVNVWKGNGEYSEVPNLPMVVEVVSGTAGKTAYLLSRDPTGQGDKVRAISFSGEAKDGKVYLRLNVNPETEWQISPEAVEKSLAFAFYWSLNAFGDQSLEAVKFPVLKI
ncbi:MAG: hypothetical protein G01um101416_1102 [Microgenomates group bacterium Gr01-1014_16]|nr:MAG: hypothetical protein G01um101416_1102 [Microgenomates group bacterium Gr01-1014_16]